MGVRGLATYIDKNQNVLRDFDLRGSALVIDGNNLYYALYHALKTGHASNGDYDAFAKIIRRFFHHLRECDVVPYVVLDGAYEPDDRKMRTVMDRLKEKLHQASLISKGYVSCKIMPVLGFETFLSALKDLSIFHCMADFEADEAMVALANDLRAPILSNDSDFFIFPLQAGFCRLDYFEHQHVRTDEQGRKFIRTKLYDIPTFCGHHPGLSPPLLPLFATLIGNDFVDASAFDNFFLNVHKPKFKRGAKGLKGNRRHCKMEGLLHWLQDVESVDQGLELLLPYMKKELHPRLRQTLRKGILGYDPSATSAVRLIDYFSSISVEEICSLVDKRGRPLPPALWRSLRSGQLAPQLLNMFVNRRSFLSFQIEDMEEDQSAVVATQIRRHLYSLIDSLSTASDSSSKEASEMREYGRDGSRLRQEAVPVTPSSTPLLEWIQRSAEERRAFFTSVVCGVTMPSAHDLILNSSSSPATCSSASSSYFSLYYLSIIFTFSDPRCRLSRLDLASLLLTHAHCALSLFRSYDGYRNLLLCGKNMNVDEASAEELAVDSLVDALNLAAPADLTGIKDRFARYVAERFKNRLRLDFIHGTAQWQSVFQTLTWLNRLLRSPFANPDPALLYDGTLAATLSGDLKGRSDWRKFVVDELFRGTDVGKAVLALFDATAGCCGRMEEAKIEGTEEKKRKKKNNKKTKGLSGGKEILDFGGEGEELEANEATADEEGEDEDIEGLWIDKNNKFSQLCLVQS